MRDIISLVEIDSSALSHVLGGNGNPPPNIREQCGTPPPNGSSSNWNVNADIPLNKIPYVGRYLPNIHIGGNGQSTSDYKTCVDAATRR
jgi:hypothetical protein